ncbi:uncharacterized protein LOC126896526 [Daktulosphaira vitifoliae]|uniref:uncharacterized protein LOC126896526 n=1 Tax=Daktulosphaira vitifoliae TaxID=58002 RepID=UPI0021AACBC3|nr:uncharacterized protein LOC126896526 [Daktulosphaira vitifoliae]
MSEIAEDFQFLYGSSMMDNLLDYVQKCAIDLSLNIENTVNVENEMMGNSTKCNYYSAIKANYKYILELVINMVKCKYIEKLKVILILFRFLFSDFIKMFMMPNQGPLTIDIKKKLNVIHFIERSISHFNFLILTMKNVLKKLHDMDIDNYIKLTLVKQLSNIQDTFHPNYDNLDEFIELLKKLFHNICSSATTFCSINNKYLPNKTGLYFEFYMQDEKNQTDNSCLSYFYFICEKINNTINETINMYTFNLVNINQVI